jgi:hypothetical protein
MKTACPALGEVLAWGVIQKLTKGGTGRLSSGCCYQAAGRRVTKAELSLGRTQPREPLGSNVKRRCS